MREVQNKNELVCVLQASFPRGLSCIIGIDGRDGVGKTCLAKNIQKQIGGTVISLDPFVAKNQGTFVPYLNKADLKTALEFKTVRSLWKVFVCSPLSQSFRPSSTF